METLPEESSVLLPPRSLSCLQPGSPSAPTKPVDDVNLAADQVSSACPLMQTESHCSQLERIRKSVLHAYQHFLPAIGLWGLITPYGIPLTAAELVYPTIH